MNAETLMETILSGIEVNPPGEYKLTQRQASPKKTKYIANRSLLCCLNLAFWTMENVIIPMIDKSTTILIIIHEKSPTEGVINWVISRIDILLWNKYIVQISKRKRRKRIDMTILFIILMNVFLTSTLITTKPKIIRQRRKSLTKYPR